MARPDPRFFILEEDLSKRLGVTRRHLLDLRNAGEITYYRFGNRVAYKIEEIATIEDKFRNKPRTQQRSGPLPALTRRGPLLDQVGTESAAEHSDGHD